MEKSDIIILIFMCLVVIATFILDIKLRMPK